MPCVWSSAYRFRFAPVCAGREKRLRCEAVGAAYQALNGLAIRFDGLLWQGAVRNRRELAEAGQVSRARLSQILQLNHLAPEIQEQLLFLPPTRRGPDPLLERHVRAVA